MTDNEIAEMLKLLGYGEEPPANLMKFIREFRKRKSALFPRSLEPTDIATITIMYDMMVALTPNSKGK